LRTADHQFQTWGDWGSGLLEGIQARAELQKVSCFRETSRAFPLFSPTAVMPNLFTSADEYGITRGEVMRYVAVLCDTILGDTEVASALSARAAMDDD
jgi:hypothetical protein